MVLPIGKWIHDSSEGETWRIGDEFDTREEAILAAIYEYGVGVDDTIWVAKVGECSLPRGFVSPMHLDQIAESFSERLDEEIGEAAEDFDWFGRAEEAAAKKAKDAHAWRMRNEIEKEICVKIEDLIQDELIKRGIWKKDHYFTLDDLEGVTVTQELFDASMKWRIDG